MRAREQTSERRLGLGIFGLLTRWSGAWEGCTFAVGAVVHLLEAEPDGVLSRRDALVLFEEGLVEALERRVNMTRESGQLEAGYGPGWESKSPWP